MPETLAAPKTAKSTSNIKETVESILVAFILAFIFRAFIVEAFVIPTGSMATTLLGAHFRQGCPECDYRFTVNYPSLEGAEGAIPGSVDPDRDKAYPPIIYCPNCGAETNTGRRVLPVHHGDRILVLKYLYLLQDPSRWDVVVFKSPYEPRIHDYQQNYIKRLVGLPGETIMILDGDIYVKKPGAEGFEVQSKPRHVQEALWRIVYDNDFQPDAQSNGNILNARRRPWVQPWQQTQGQGQWNMDGRVFTFNNLQAAGTIEFDRTANTDTHSFTEWLAYNVRDLTDERTRLEDLNFISDLKLDLYYERKAGDGPLRLMLTKLDRTFIAEITKDRIRLLEDGVGMPLVESSFDGSGPLHLEFSNVDYEVRLRVNENDLIQYKYQPDQQTLRAAYVPRGRHRLTPPRVQISAENQQAEISHLGLYRDIYYANSAMSNSSQSPIRARPDNPFVLGEDDYFVLGDNSLASLDARMWPEPIILENENLEAQAGVVPGRFMLGKAFFVYWPAGFHPLLPKVPGFIPNFAEMRFIH